MKWVTIDRACVPSALLAALLLLPSCGDGPSGTPASAPRQPANPLVEGPVTGGGGPDCCKILFGGAEIDVTTVIAYEPGTPFYPPTLTFDEAEVGYRETEFFVSGTATAYRATSELGQDGRWSVEPADTAPFKTRIVVMRPENPDDFSGTVVVEWFNVSGGTDAAPDFIQLHTEIFRRGHAWVGVSAQSIGIEGGGTFEGSLKTIDRQRYGSLRHPGDSFSYDIFSQAAQAVRRPTGLAPLDGLEVRSLLGVGESQSAGRMATYVNAIHPTVDLFDGFLIHSRRTGAAPLSQAPQSTLEAPRPTFIRTDLAEPVIGFEAEGDIAGREDRPVAIPNPDSENFRLWEVPGNAHFDAYGVVKGPGDRGDDPGVAEVIEFSSPIASGLISCDRPINDGPGHWVLKAALRALDTWVETGDPAPAAERVPRKPDGSDVERDAYGNGIGGIRTPYVEVPVAIFTGGGQTGSSFCSSFGTTSLFGEERLSQLYPTRQDYVAQIDAATDRAVRQGFLLPEDGELIKAQARLSEKFPR